MAGLARVTQSLFSTTGLTGTGGFAAAANGTTTTQAGSSNTPSNIMTAVAGAWDAGWLGATLGASKFPAVEDMNAVDYVFSYQLAYLLERGIPEYAAGTTYNIGDIVRGIGLSTIYKSIVNSNVGNALSNTADWQFCGDLTQLLGGLYWGGTSGGSANAQTITTGAALSALVAGNTFGFVAGFTNTTDATLAIDSVAAKHIKMNTSAGLTTLPGNMLVAGNQYVTQWNGTDLVLIGGALNVPNFYQANGLNPTGTSSTSGVMMALGGALTPNKSGVVEVTISGSIATTGTGSNTVRAQIRYGTGTAPTNGAAVTGTAVGNLANMEPVTASVVVPFSCNAIIPALTLGTAYWFDASLTIGTAGTGTITSVGITVKEL